MKNTSLFSRVFRWIPLAALLVSSFVSVGCMTTYDAYGRPMQTVDPAVAVAGVVAAGAIGYAIADHNSGCGYYGPHRYRCY